MQSKGFQFYFVMCVFVWLQVKMCCYYLCVIVGRMQGDVGSLWTKLATGSHWRLCSTQHVQSVAARVRQ